MNLAWQAATAFSSDKMWALMSPKLMEICLLAKIFGRKITSWGDEEIVARNPDLDGSDLQISVARRVRGSSSTDSITNVSNMT